MKLILKPKSFEIGARKINFVRSREIDNWLDDSDAIGMSNYGTHNKIAIRSGLPEDNEHVTNYHEIIHIILEHIRRHELSKDEDFVDSFAESLYQVLKTLK